MFGQHLLTQDAGKLSAAGGAHDQSRLRPALCDGHPEVLTASGASKLSGMAQRRCAGYRRRAAPPHTAIPDRSATPWRRSPRLGRTGWAWSRAADLARSDQHADWSGRGRAVFGALAGPQTILPPQTGDAVEAGATTECPGKKRAARRLPAPRKLGLGARPQRKVLPRPRAWLLPPPTIGIPAVRDQQRLAQPF